VSLHLVIEDPSPCSTCKGNQVLLYDGLFGLDRDEVPCPDCCCEVCGDTTETAPLCKACDERQRDG